MSGSAQRELIQSFGALLYTVSPFSSVENVQPPATWAVLDDQENRFLEDL